MHHKPFLFFFALLPLLLFSACKTQQNTSSPKAIPEGIPEGLKTHTAFKTFTKGNALGAAKTVALPGSDLWLVYATVARPEEDVQDANDPADRFQGRIFVYAPKANEYHEAKTNALNEALGADEFYNETHCGGLGSLDVKSFRAEGEKVLLEQFYAPAREHYNCLRSLKWNKEKETIEVTMEAAGETGP